MIYVADLVADLAADRLGARANQPRRARDPSVLIVAAGPFIVIAVGGVMRPAIRAASLDPVETLRSE